MILGSRYSKIKLSEDAIIGKKSDKPGYVFAPYIMATTISVISEKESRVDKLKRIIDRLKFIN